MGNNGNEMERKRNIRDGRGRRGILEREGEEGHINDGRRRREGISAMKGGWRILGMKGGERNNRNRRGRRKGI